MDSLLIRVLDELPLGVVLIDASGKVVHFNKTEEELAHRKRENVLGRRFFEEIAPCMNVRGLADEFGARIGKGPFSLTREFSFPFPWLEKPREAVVRLSSFEEGSLHYGFMTIEEVTQKRALERMQQTLSALLVHDLKNPLAIMSANLEFLEGSRSVTEAGDARAAVEDSLKATRRLQHMVVDLLDVTALEAGEMRVDRGPVDLGRIVADAAAEAQGLARAHGLRLSAKEPQGSVALTGDGGLIRRALDNLIENALRHTRAPGEVVVSSREVPGGAQLAVTDDGPGIPEALRSRIFDKYAQVETANRARCSNRGLGLTLVKMVANAHGGSARVECPPAGGSIFRLTLARIPGPLPLAG